MTSMRQGPDGMTLRKTIAGMGRRFDAEVLAATRALFEPLWADDDAVAVETVAYGSDERHVADIYRTARTSAPVLLFVPGGGFTGGSRAGYTAFGRHLALMGHVVIIADYRLAPHSTWPAGAQDVARVTEWVGQHAAGLGGDPRSLFLFGHSAGATHVAGAVFDSRLQPANLADVKGVVLGSGVYHLAEDERRENVLAYFGEDRTLFADRSPLTHVAGGYPDMLLFAAEHDPETFVASAGALDAALARMGGPMRRLQLIEGHNHVSTVFAVGTGYGAIGGMIGRHIAAAMGQEAAATGSPASSTT